MRQRVATCLSMSLSLPGGRVLPLGGDRIPWPNQIPELLLRLTNGDLVELLRRFDDDLTRLRSEGARNWCSLHDRMGFICELFRAEQLTETMFGQPFSDAARGEILKGRIPGAGI